MGLLMGPRFPPRAFSISIASPPRLPLRHVVRALIFLSVLSSSTARDMAASAASSPPSHTEEMTPLQKHVSFFDRNKDGVIYPWETYQEKGTCGVGFRAIGCGAVLSSASALFINGMLSPKTLPAGKSTSPLLPVYVTNIHKGKHAGDSGVYDTEGRFVPENFEEIFQKHAHAHPDSLTSMELMEMLKANKDPKDNSAWVAAYTEWTVLYGLCKDKNGLLHKETIRSLYDGSLFYQMEKERNSPSGIPVALLTSSLAICHCIVGPELLLSHPKEETNNREAMNLFLLAREVLEMQNDGNLFSYSICIIQG
ncbi:hypothetical protein Taro_053697 [Colocasia esculenta]|uniref:Peroxygenase 4 n=1 Tax=Colocasia esculenta TaxID=4460 RepID=A0A843XNC8_COLES|nr:hypothetical protein [Colocasia esculenta]